MSSGLTVLAATLFFFSPVGTVSAQNALDHNLRQGSGGTNADWVNQRYSYLYRNAILTGNVPNRSFRGELGYTATFDFRGELGSDDFFRFERDSYLSGLALQGIRGVQMVQTTVRSNDPNQFARYTVSRSARGETLNDVRRRKGNALFSPVGAPPAANTLGGERYVRSLAQGITTVDTQGTVVGYSSAPDGSVSEMVASTLRGLVAVPLIKAPDTSALPKPETLKFATNPEKTNEISDRENNRIDTRLDVRLIEQGMDPYADLLDKLSRANNKTDVSAENTTDSQDTSSPGQPSLGDVVETPEQRMQRLMTFEEQFRLLNQELEKAPATTEGESKNTDTGKPGDNGGGLINLNDLEPKFPEEQKLKLPPSPTTSFDEMLKQLLPRDVISDIPPVTDLAGHANTLFARQMRTGQDYLVKGRYFDAEAAFIAANEIKQGYPLAQIGKLNAQIGAGLYRSAGATLRALAVSHPEVISVTYDARLLPHKKRLQHVIETLRKRADSESSFAPTASLLLAYIGHMTGDEDLLNSGLEGMRKSDDPDKLVHLLTTLWTDSGSTDKDNDE